MREHQIVITLKPEQFLQVQKLARNAGAKSMGMYVRQQLLAALGIEGQQAAMPSSAAVQGAELQNLGPVVGDLKLLHGQLRDFVAEALSAYSTEYNMDLESTSISVEMEEEGLPYITEDSVSALAYSAPQDTSVKVESNPGVANNIAAPVSSAIPPGIQSMPAYRASPDDFGAPRAQESNSNYASFLRQQAAQEAANLGARELVQPSTFESKNEAVLAPHLGASPQPGNEAVTNTRREIAPEPRRELAPEPRRELAPEPRRDAAAEQGNLSDSVNKSGIANASPGSSLSGEAASKAADPAQAGHFVQDTSTKGASNFRAHVSKFNAESASAESNAAKRDPLSELLDSSDTALSSASAATKHNPDLDDSYDVPLSILARRQQLAGQMRAVDPGSNSEQNERKSEDQNDKSLRAEPPAMPVSQDKPDLSADISSQNSQAQKAEEKPKTPPAQPSTGFFSNYRPLENPDEDAPFSGGPPPKKRQ